MLRLYRMLVHAQFVRTQLLGADQGHHPLNVPPDSLGVGLLERFHANQALPFDIDEEQHARVYAGHLRPGPVDPKDTDMDRRGLGVQRPGVLAGLSDIAFNGTFGALPLKGTDKGRRGAIAQAEHVEKDTNGGPLSESKKRVSRGR
jgi:hypothetical protein